MVIVPASGASAHQIGGADFIRPGQIAGDGGSQRNMSRAFTSVAHISSHALQLGVGSATTRLRL